ncbi:hypothetical protein D3C86_1469920 [compost metagenome]
MTEVLDLIPAKLAGQRHHQVNALAAAGLEECLEPQFIEHRKGQLSRLDHAFPGQRRVRVEVEDEAVGFVEVVRRGVPGVQFDRAHLHRADQGFGVVDDHHRLAGEGLVQGGDPRNRQALGVLLEKQLAGDAVRGAHQCHGPILELGQYPFGDAGVILGQLHFGGAAAGVDHPVRVGDAHLALAQADL